VSKNQTEQKIGAFEGPMDLKWLLEKGLTSYHCATMHYLLTVIPHAHVALDNSLCIPESGVE